jgi:hypothetical protein
MENQTVKDKHFIEWFHELFGYCCYGTSEEYILQALATFFECCRKIHASPSYNYEELEEKLTPATAWLLIQIFADNNIISYGTSPRYAWLERRGILIKEFIEKHSIDDLLKMIDIDEKFSLCGTSFCNCDSYEIEITCPNPLFKNSKVSW